MEPVIQAISKEIKIKCLKCEFEGTVTATRVYYIDCPECNRLIYVAHLTGKV